MTLIRQRLTRQKLGPATGLATSEGCFTAGVNLTVGSCTAQACPATQDKMDSP